jgi:mannose-1-phosphate guanylyltransferase
MSWNADKNHRWAVVLAGGDGLRLREVTRRIAGDSRPKQFCPFFGGKTLLTETRERIAPLFHEEQTIFSLTRAHERFYWEQLAGSDARQQVIQPLNRGTAVAMALCLEIIARQDEDALIAFFPSDHHFVDCSAFRETVDYALRLMGEYPQSVLVLGAEAQYPEVEYGWIQPGRTLVDSPVHPLERVTRFWEKPSLQRAEVLHRHGCMWNTFVTMGLAGVFLELFGTTIPQLTRTLGACLTDGRLERFYDETSTVDFSRAVLSRVPERLVVLRDAKSGWMDLGSPRRITEVLNLSGMQPPWLVSGRNGVSGVHHLAGGH